MEPAAQQAKGAAQARRGGVKVMAYDQRFANSVVRQNASFTDTTATLTSFNGEKEHVTDVDLPEESWLGRMRARLEFARQCREGRDQIVVQTMRPELGPRVVNLSSTFVGLGRAWDGKEMVDASLWSARPARPRPRPRPRAVPRAPP